MWRAFYAVEPRGERRADFLAAFLARLQISNEEVGLKEVLESIEDMWTPMDEGRRQKRHKDRKRKWKRKIKANAAQARVMQEAGNGHVNR